MGATDYVSPSTTLAVDFDHLDVLVTTTGTCTALLEPLPDTIGMVLMIAHKFRIGILIQTNTARRIHPLQRHSRSSMFGPFNVG